MPERRAIVVRGIVQGVGFRPYVYQLATRLHLGGFVQNRTGTVRVEVEGDARTLDEFLAQLGQQPPPLARIEHVSWEPRPPLGEREFRIAASEAEDDSPIFISPDVATCEACLRELSDPADRRHQYPFLNCTHCGPRLTIVTGAPYDRARTTMASFPMCDACRAEYDDPANRRYHAQPTACGACGPALEAVDAQGGALTGAKPLDLFVAAVRLGRIGALKGLGGYHLVCDARHEGAVSELRRRKQRDERPLALMVRDVGSAETLCEVSADERSLLLSPRRPIVLLRRRPSAPIAPSVAPGNPFLGVMLPYTPLHHLLLAALPEVALVMTSGNRSDEPIAYQDADALARLAGIADVFLRHNRPIHVRCDDSVTRWVDGQEFPLRRSRGYAPLPIALPIACSHPLLAVGGQLKNTFALGRDGHAIVSHHLGDLDHFEAYQAFVRDIELYQELFAIEPGLLVADLHPDYSSTRYARDRAARDGIRLLPVQHHHAHLASCMAEHGLTQDVIGVIFDGSGYGTDGATWGGEFLVGDYRRFHRAAHLRYVGLPGGDRAIREPWRMAAAHLLDAQGHAEELAGQCSGTELRIVTQMLDRRFQTPLTSSVGRLFDAVAALAGVRSRVSYEGQAAVELEWLATTTAPDGSYPWELAESAGCFVIDTRPLIRAVAQDVKRRLEAARIARRFHTTMVELVANVCQRIRARTALHQVVLSGGVFLNVVLTCEVGQRLQAEGFRVFRQTQVPPNDGGLSLGQLAIAAAQL